MERRGDVHPATLQLEAGTVDLARGVMHRGDDRSELTTKELALLAYLVARSGAAVSRDELLREVWGFRGNVPNSRAPDFTMRRLRQKIELDFKRPRHLLTVHGEGYRFLASSSQRVSAPRSQPPGAPYTRDGYAARPGDEAAARSLLIHPGAPVVISGPARVGKTWFLDHLLVTEAGPGDVVVRIEADQLEPVLEDGAHSSLEQLALELAYAIPAGEAALREVWAKAGHERRRLTRFVERCVLPAIEGRLILALDGADRWSSDGDPSGFFGMLRSWVSLRRPAWEDFRLLLTISTDPALLVEDARLSPFNLAPPVRLGDLPRESLDMLAEGVALSASHLDDLHHLTHGHAELVRRAIYAVATGTLAPDRAVSTDAMQEEPFGSFLKTRLEALRARPGLAHAVRQVLSRGQEPDVRESSLLVSAGVLMRVDGRLQPSSPLLERYLRAYL